MALYKTAIDEKYGEITTAKTNAKTHCIYKVYHFGSHINSLIKSKILSIGAKQTSFDQFILLWFEFGFHLEKNFVDQTSNAANEHGWSEIKLISKVEAQKPQKFVMK